MSYAVGGRDARAFYPLWNLDYESPAGIFFECWQFSLFQKEVHSSVCACVLMHVFLSSLATFIKEIVIVNSLEILKCTFVVHKLKKYIYHSCCVLT